jgi:hypothetical protein
MSSCREVVVGGLATDAVVTLRQVPVARFTDQATGDCLLSVSILETVLQELHPPPVPVRRLALARIGRGRAATVAAVARWIAMVRGRHSVWAGSSPTGGAVCRGDDGARAVGVAGRRPRAPGAAAGPARAPAPRRVRVRAGMCARLMCSRSVDGCPSMRELEAMLAPLTRLQTLIVLSDPALPGDEFRGETLQVACKRCLVVRGVDRRSCARPHASLPCAQVARGVLLARCDHCYASELPMPTPLMPEALQQQRSSVFGIGCAQLCHQWFVAPGRGRYTVCDRARSG